MSDYTELQKAAEYAAQDTIKFADEGEEMRALQQFHEEVDPETVLALIAENERLSTACTRAEQVINAESKDAAIATGRANLLQAERDQLKAENEALREDARRHRWLRDSCGLVEYKAIAGSIGPGMLPSGEALDAAIDAAMGKGDQS